MDADNRKLHWNTIYKSKNIDEVSWFQPTPETSLNLIAQFNLPLHAKIIDIGGGDSFLVDHLINLGYTNISVLDISEEAIKKAQLRLGNKASVVTWIVADSASFAPTETYDLWHDRASFHFLTKPAEINHYLNTACKHISPLGKLVLGTFSEDGPLKCSGITITRYSETEITKLFAPCFDRISCFKIIHQTPFNTQQNFLFSSFQKNKVNHC